MQPVLKKTGIGSFFLSKGVVKSECGLPRDAKSVKRPFADLERAADEIERTAAEMLEDPHGELNYVPPAAAVLALAPSTAPLIAALSAS